MTEQEYLDEIKIIERKAKNDKYEAAVRYVFSNQSNKIGDVVSCSSFTIKVDSLEAGFSFGANIPECKYYGECLTKKGQPRKDGQRGTIGQGAIVK